MSPSPSYWAASGEPLPDSPKLVGNVSCDVAVIGGGITGLSAAWHLAKRGLVPVVLDASQPGWGASGRNGGFISPKFGRSFRDIAEGHGIDVARRLYRIGREAVDGVESLVAELGISGAGFSRCGALTAISSEAALQRITGDVEWMRQALGDRSTILTADEMREEAGVESWIGGALTPSAGSVHPLNYVRGIARHLRKTGVRIFGNSRVLRITRDSGSVIVSTETGIVRAKQVVVATNGYTEGVAALRRFSERLIPVPSAIIVTEKLPKDLLERLIPRRRTMADSRRILRYFRIVDDRFLLGGRGSLSSMESARHFGRLECNLRTLFPVLRDYPTVYRWSGFVALTMDGLPHLGWADDRTLVGMGCNGNGMACGTLFGRYLSDMVCGETPDLPLLGFDRFAPFPFHRFRAPAVRLAIGWRHVLDGWDERSSRR